MLMKDYVVVITGAASGIGLESSRKFIQQGAKVVGADLDENGLKKAHSELGEVFIPKVCNVTNASEIEKLAQFVREKFYHLDILINNAGVGKFGITPEMMKEEDYYYHFEVLVKGPMLLVHYFAPLLKKSSHPSIINISSIAARITTSGHFLYSSAKAAMEKFTGHLVRDLPGIRVNCILPGWIDTPIYPKETGLSREQIQEIFNMTLSRIPCARIGLPEDIANCMLFLSSQQASYINGASIVIDGGYQFNSDWGI